MTSTTLREMLVKQEPRNASTCYVCAGSRAEYLISAKPSHENAFFPFLEHHQPPEGAESMRSDGKVLVCLVCCTLLNQQWDSYERSKTPYNKRIYWLKRLDGGPFAGMDANLQQDYESLFESSNAATETDSRAKPKQSRNRHSTEVDVMKNKHPERVIDPYSKPFNFSSQVVERPESQGQNILDLSLPARTPSRSSNSASPGVLSEVCYTCGQESRAFVKVYLKYVSTYPFFISLATVSKPPRAKPIDADGRIHVCEHCSLSLFKQWEYYQKRNTPHHERFYKVGNPVPELVKSDPQPKEKSFVCYTCGMVTQVSVQRFIYAYPEKEGEPFFSFLLHVNPHPGANKLHGGRAAVCSVCYKNFLRQYRVYELSNTPEEKRKYKILNESVSDSSSVLRQHLENTTVEPEEPKCVCYLCESVTDALTNVNSLPMGDMYFPFIKGMSKPASALPMDGKGRVKVCSQCHNSLTYQWNAFEQAFIPINQRQYKIPGSKSQAVENHYSANSLPANPHSSYTKPVLAEDEYKFSLKKSTSGACSLCDNVLNLDSACFLETLPRENCMYFPTIRSAFKPGCNSFTDQYGRILACSHCSSVLKNQWEVFESARVPHSQRQYEIFPPKTRKEHASHYSNEVPMSEPSAALHIQVSSPDLKVDLSKHSSNVEPLLTTVNTLPLSSMTISNATISTADSGPPDLKAVSSKTSADDSISSTRICGPLDVPFVRPLLLVVPICCYVCGEYNSTGVTYSIRSVPHPDIRVEKADEVPFFPFLSKHPMPEGAEKMKDSNALVCMFCYHSLVSQWLAYEISNNPEDENKWLRRYNSHNYVCFICGITTYRKRVCSISVKDFPFLLEHKRPAGALTVINGECVVTCQTCFESITSQFKDFERMKVPVEMRKYNWIVMPPPPDDENSHGCQILQENSGGLLSLPQGECDPALIDESGIPHGLKPSSSHLSVPTPYGVPKSMGRNVVSPVHQSGPHANSGFSPFANNINPALNATRASSFAAALRKLAKQAVDPIADKDLSPATSPASSYSSRHHAPMPMYMNSHGNNPPHHGSPSPIVPPPLQNSQGKALDLGRYSNSHRNGSIPEPVSLKMDNSKHISSSSSDKRNEVSSGSKHMGHHNMPPTLRQEHSLSRGFQPYRNSEERRSTPPQMYNPSPPPNTMSGYAYHPSYVQSSRLPPQSYRLEENAYMERYGLLRPSTMPYPSPSNIIPHPRAPLYPSSQYPPELIPQSVRSAPGGTGYQNSRYNHEEESVKESNLVRKREMELYREHERQQQQMEQEEAESREREAEYLRKERAHLRQSPLSQHHLASRQDVNNEEKGLMGSITHGTPRDYQRNLSPPPVSTTTTPLNLHVENHLAHKEDYRHSRHGGSTVNGQLPPRKNNHHSYRKENDPNSSYRMHYPPMNVEKEQKPPVSMDTSDSSSPAPSHPKPTLYYAERDARNQDVIETRTLSMEAVINSKINGIFSREKIACNIHYGDFDYGDKPPKFLNSSGGTPDNQSKADSEFRKLFTAQESYANPSKVSGGKKPLQSLSSDLASSAHQYKLNDHPSYVYPADPNGYQPNFKPKEQPRMLLQEQPIPTSYENEMHPAEEQPSHRVVSILDAREAKLKKKRLEGLLVESDESGIESDEEGSQQLRRLLSIRSVSPVKMEPDPKKTKFLSKFDLVTHSKKFDIELSKSIRRHKLLREKSASPVQEESPIEEPLAYDTKHLSELSDRLCLTEDFQSRTEFLKSLGLTYLPPEQKSAKEKIRKAVQEEKLRRYGILKPSQRCLELPESPLGKRDYTVPSEGLKPDPAKKPNLTQNDTVPSSLPELTDIKKEGSSKESKPIISSVQRLSSFMKPPMRTVSLPVPPLIPTYQVMPPASEGTPEKGTTVVAAKDPRVRQLNKEFAQEFHNSVLQTTQMQLEKKTSHVVPMETSLQKSPSSMSSASERLDWSPGEFRLPLKWPGIEAIMESYECHISEQSVEKKFLLESCQKLKASHDESYLEMECLSRKTEELMQEKKLLDSQTRELQINLENLKLFIRHFR